MHLQRYPVWDLPCRLSHWAIAILFTAQLASGQLGLFPMAVHIWLGYALLVTVLFRLIWGFVGSDSARFGHFLAGPGAVAGYLKRFPGSAPLHWPGHNPLGGWSVLLMLALLLAQAGTGLFVETWDELRGPLAERVDRPTAIALTDIHFTLNWLLLAVVLAHVAAAVYYRLRKNEDRIGPIFASGRIALPQPPDLRFAGPGRAVFALAASAAVVGAIARWGPI